MYDIWRGCYPSSSLTPQAIEAWVFNAHDAESWQDFFSHETLRQDTASQRYIPTDTLLQTMGSDTAIWRLAWEGLSLVPTHSTRGAVFRTLGTSQQLPYAALEALVHIVEEDTKVASQFAGHLLAIPPTFLFGHFPPHDLGEPLHRLSTMLMENAPIALGRLPSLEWSPSALYDEYGLPPSTHTIRESSIQHALEYAVCKKESDPLALAEWHAYAKKAGIHPEGLETLLDLSTDPTKRTLADVVRVVQTMLLPTALTTYEIQHVEPNL